ncbi:MAG: putative TIM-barrel fold metal-dependent hydrolase [Rubritalea sp.]|jgi:predicted TIM-barrel fold metal-dependent hydrolase
MMVKGLGLPKSSLKTGLDELYVKNLLENIRESEIDAAVILAQDIPYSHTGEKMPNEAQFYVPNEYVSELARKHEEFIPACSIHPGRPDAMDELEKCIEAKMPVLKLLPNCLNIDYMDKKYIPFWERMQEAGMILLTHTGGEMTVKVYDPSFGDPKKLEILLDCGVTTIAAHSAGRSGLFDGDWTGDLLGLFKRFPHLYGDNSALSSLNRARTLKHILPEEIQSRIIHGSDYPVPVSGLGPMLMGKLSWSDYKATGKIPNIIERDYQLKQKIGFNAKTFTRMDELLRRV